VTAAVTALAVLWPKLWKKLCANAEKREAVLKELFNILESGKESSEGREVSDKSELISEIEVELQSFISKLRIQLSLPGDFKILPYAEFFVSAKPVEEGNVADRDKKAGAVYSADAASLKARANDLSASTSELYEWFQKNPSYKEHIRGDGSMQAVVRYIKDNDINQKKPLLVAIDGYSWRVLDKDEDKALLLTEYVIGKGPLDLKEMVYNQGYSFNWKECLLRAELNSLEWKIQYLPTLSAGDWIGSADSGDIGKELFILSAEECKKYMSNRNAKEARDLFGARAWWWLRSPGGTQDSAADVAFDGSVYGYGGDVGPGHGGVRPAFWLNLKS
jgi:hypothetical protein